MALSPSFYRRHRTAVLVSFKLHSLLWVSALASQAALAAWVWQPGVAGRLRGPPERHLLSGRAPLHLADALQQELHGAAWRQLHLALLDSVYVLADGGRVSPCAHLASHPAATLSTPAPPGAYPLTCPPRPCRCNLCSSSFPWPRCW